jgi:hypothetical protein
LTETGCDCPWGGEYKIPWNDPAFSRRMLAEHLSQSHDMASRRVEWIDRQVEWIDKNLLAGHPADITGSRLRSGILLSPSHRQRPSMHWDRFWSCVHRVRAAA